MFHIPNKNAEKFSKYLVTSNPFKNTQQKYSKDIELQEKVNPQDIPKTPDQDRLPTNSHP